MPIGTSLRRDLGPYRSLREGTRPSGLKDAIREAIKLKVADGAETEQGDQCVSCGGTHGLQDPCELPTLEEAIRQAILRKLGRSER